MGGGAGNATHQTALCLSRRGHEVHVLTSRLRHQPDVHTEGTLVVHRTFSLRKSLHQAGLFGAATYLASALQRLRRLLRTNHFDVFHFYFALPTGLLALYVHYRHKRPYVVSLRGSDVSGYDNTRWYLRPLHWLLSPLTGMILNNAAYVTALSRNLRALEDSGHPDLDIQVIGNGIDRSLFPRNNRPKAHQNIRLICVCRIVRRKGLDYLLDAMSELANDGVTLDIVGTGECAADIHRSIRRLNLENSVRMVGYIPREQLHEHYNEADIFVLPSLSESFGQVLLEAMSCGLPIIASRVGGIPETVRESAGGILVEPASSQAIVGAVRQLSVNPDLREKMGEFNAELARTEYQWSGIADKYEELYYSSIKSGHQVEKKLSAG